VAKVIWGKFWPNEYPYRRGSAGGGPGGGGCGWQHSGFSVDQSVLLPAGDRAGIERLVQYMTRCPFSLARLVKVTESGQVVYKAEKQACRAFPDPNGDGMQSGP